MSDDPREVLKAAGVECAEVERWSGLRPIEDQLPQNSAASVLLRQTKCIGGVTVLALARLVAKYKWQRDECADELGRKLAVDYEYEATKPFAAQDVIVDLNRRWTERNA